MITNWNIQAAATKAQAYTIKIQQTKNDFLYLQAQWRQMKIDVRVAHWRKNISQAQKQNLSISPWRLIKKLRKAEAFIELYEQKIRYYRLIVNNEAKPHADYELIRNRILELVQAIDIIDDI